MKFRDCVRKGDVLKLYVDEVPLAAPIKLDLTTNPLGFPPRVLASLGACPSDLDHYNEPPELPELKKAVATHSGVQEDQIMITAGADQAIELALAHIVECRTQVGILAPTFPRFEIVARRLCDAETILFKNLEKLPPGCQTVVLCTPNNPTTEEIGKTDLEKVISENQEKTFVIDAVFDDFGTQKVSDLINEFENVIVIKSVSKSFGLPGIRIGWVESRTENIDLLREGVSPFRVPFVCQKIAAEALKDSTHISKTIEFLSQEFAKIKRAFGGRAIRKSNVPFFLFLVKNAPEVKEWLLRKGIKVVDSSSFKGADSEFLRIMIGTREQNKRVIEDLKLLTETER